MEQKPNYFPNMNLVRYVLALSVLLDHYNDLAHHSVPFVIAYKAVGAFFAFSGFLNYPGYFRHATLRRYVGLRARRILPQYFFIILLCTFGLSAVSTLPLWEYLTHPGTWKYLAANSVFLTWLHPSLPGVFEGPQYVMSAVNGSLWTMKVEWCQFLSIPIVVWLTRRFRLSSRRTAVGIILLSMLYRFTFVRLYVSTGSEIYNILGRQIFGQMSFFYTGVLIYLCRDWFTRHLRVVFIASLCGYLLIDYIPYANIFITPIALSSLVLSISLYRRTPKFLSHRTNYSYYIYLFHFPLIQLSICLGINAMPTPVSLAFVVGATLLLSICADAIIRRLFPKPARKGASAT